jgi:Repeat of unknown function (DUF346)
MSQGNTRYPVESVGSEKTSGRPIRHIRNALAALFLAAIVDFPGPAAQAAWNGWEGLGGIILEAPNCTSWGANRIDCFARGTDRAMYHRWWDGNAWGGWEDLGGIILDAPNCVSWSANRIDCFARGTDRAMYHRWWDGQQWGGWEDLGGIILEAPNCTSWGAERIDCFARGTDRAMYHRWWDGNAWGGWESLGGIILESPSCVTWGPNRIDCFARGTDAAMYHRWWDGQQWGGWEDLGGVILEAPNCVSWDANRIDCFARGTDQAMYHRWWDGNMWGGWEDLGGVILEAPNCESWGANRIDCFARGTDAAMYHRWWDGSTWGGWEDLDGGLLEGPYCLSWGANRIDCFARGTDAAMYHQWWDCASCNSLLAVRTYHYDSLRTGWNPHETTLTPANVKAPGFGLLHSITLDDQVDAQPLFVADQFVAGQGNHDVVYVVTESNTVYMIDAGSGAVLKQQNLGPPVPQSKIQNCTNNAANVGINSTPLIDTASHTLYVIALVLQGGNPVYHLHALDLSSLADKVPSVAVAASHTLTDGSTYNLNASFSRQRSGLVAVNGNIYAAFASWCDLRADMSRGWLLGWQAGSLAPLPANRLNNRIQPDPVPPHTPLPYPFYLSSIWMSGFGVGADAFGSLFVVTGNSDSNKNTNATSYSPTNNLQESVVKLSPDLGTVLSYFTPSGPAGVIPLDHDDIDFGSGGVMLLPYQPGPRQRLATAAGKIGQMFLLDRNNLGGYNPNGPNNVLGTFDIGGCWCGQSYFLGSDGVGRVVSSGGNSAIVWRLQTSPNVTLAKESTSAALSSGQDAGFLTSVSSNGQVPGSAIIWAVARPTNANPANVTLYALDAGNGATLFSGTAGTWPNVNGNANLVPVVANGKVYVASFKRLTIFGLGQTIPFPAALPAVAEALEAPTGNRISGTISKIDGFEVTLTTRTGSTTRIDATKAQQQSQSIPLVVGGSVIVDGAKDASGVMHAETITRAKPDPALWPADR